jgi:Mg2+-importing ATPase
MIVFGLISSLFDVATFAALLIVFHADEATFQTAWFMVSLLTELVVVLVLRTQKPAFRSRPSALLLWLTIVVGAAALAIPFLGSFLGVPDEVFGFVPLSSPLMGAMVAIVVAYVVATEIAKLWFFRRAREAPVSRQRVGAAP